ncbi:MAG TPA: nucleotide disphospho-sugar-binding domain-containing protein [Rhizomicrobium sp.]|jgi:rhamnosyltransferase subunit B
MKFLIVSLGSIGDLMPFLAVAERLRARGHQAVIASNAGYAQLVHGAGFEFAAIWQRDQQSLDEVIAHDPLAAWRTVRAQMFVPATQPAFNFIADHARGGPCTILASWSAFGARRAHAQLKLPLCNVYLSPGAIAEDTETFAKGTRCRSIGFFPDWFAATRSGMPDDIEPTGFPLFDDALIPALPAPLEAFLQQGPPPVIFTPGSFMRQAGAFFRASLTACERLGLRAVFLTPYRDQIPDSLPPGILHFSYVALQRLAPRAAALVSHGGIGTCAQALKAGIPQLLTPVFFDQFDNAARLEALGVGAAVAGDSADDIAAKLQTVLMSQTVRQKCQALRARFGDNDPLERICDIALSLA